MSNNSKFTIYYQPCSSSYEYIKSITLSFSRLENEDNIYKKKLILEHKSKTRNAIEEYKMKEVHIGADKIKEKINKIDFNQEKKVCETNGLEDYFLIQYGDKKIETSNKEEIQYILDMFNFDNLMTITHKHYSYIKDMDEYTELTKILYSKIPHLKREDLIMVSSEFKFTDPYHIFQRMPYFEYD
jgi:hypothetical protein